MRVEQCEYYLGLFKTQAYHFHYPEEEEHFAVVFRESSVPLHLQANCRP